LTVVNARRVRLAYDRGMSVELPPIWLIRAAVAAVWIYEGLWCKLLRGQPHELAVVEAVPRFGPKVGARFLQALGVVEVALGGWVLSGAEPRACAITQTVLLIALNANGLVWARHLIHDPAGMVVKNTAFLVLAWVAAGWPH
jgi:hypothetical protein